MKMLVISPPPTNDSLVEKDGRANVVFQNHLNELHQTITNFMRSSEYTTQAGGATQAITVEDAEPGDFVKVSIKQAGATPRSIIQESAGNGVINVVMSGDPGNDHVLSWALFKLQ